MSTPTNFYIPATQTYSEIEPAFQTCANGDYIIPVAWGAASKVIGRCQEYRLGSGQCIGAFHSRDVDTRDTPWSCINQENQAVNVCKMGHSVLPSSQSPSTSSQSPSPLLQRPSSSQQQPSLPSSGILSLQVRSLKDFAKMGVQNAELAQVTRPTNPPLAAVIDPTLDVNQGYLNPYINGSNPYMNYDVFDRPFLSRGTQSTSDPAGYTMGVNTYVGLRQRAEASSLLPNEPWGSCSSYGTYSAAPNATLSANSCNGNNCVCGDYTQPASVALAQKMY